MHNGRLLGLTASTFNTSSTGSGAAAIQAVSLDADRTLLLYGSTSCYARVFRKSTGAWSAPALVRASIVAGGFVSVLSATNQLLVVSSNATTGMQACTLSINSSTDAITVNGSPASVTLASTFAAFGQLIAVGSSWVVAYGRSANSGIRSMTISGTTVALGNETQLASASAIPGVLYAASGTVLMTFCASSSLLSATPYTISGSTAPAVHSLQSLYSGS